jgi:hypothetical protein
VDSYYSTAAATPMTTINFCFIWNTSKTFISALVKANTDIKWLYELIIASKLRSKQLR